MRCSICKSECVVNGKALLETLDEHVTCSPVCEKDKYVCSNQDCIGHQYNLCWNFMGDAYYHYGHQEELGFIDNLSGAFGTHSRQWEAEGKTDDDRILFTFPCWPRKGWKLKLRYEKHADQEGNILKRRRYYDWITHENVIHMSGWRMIKYSLGQLKHLKRFDRGAYLRYLQDNVKHMERPKAEWWRKVVGKYSQFLLWLQPKSKMEKI